MTLNPGCRTFTSGISLGVFNQKIKVWPNSFFEGYGEAGRNYFSLSEKEVVGWISALLIETRKDESRT